uniref:Clathrin light chain n=1 Tax=Elaeophora elaphi TaxID=1147741 RepID=A0A158Q8V4_9BILA
MSCISEKSDYFNNHWTSSNSERSFPKMSSEGSSDEMDDKMNSNSDTELNVTADWKKSSLFGSDLELNFASNIHSSDSCASARGCRQNANKVDYVVDEIPGLVDDDFTDSAEISDDGKSENELANEIDDEFIMKQLEKLIIRRNKKDNEARLRWLTFLREQKEAEEEAKQFRAYWERRHQEDKDLWRDKVTSSSHFKLYNSN